jgi:hypothetical protein
LKEEEKYLKMYGDFIEKNNLFFSDDYNLSNTFNENIIINQEINKEKENENYKKHYCWNISQIEDLKNLIESEKEEQGENNILKITKRNEIEKNIKKDEIDFEFIKPIINGFVEIRCIKDYDKFFIFCVIARKDNRRTGMRYLCRGADLNGYCANFVETETLIFINDSKEYDYVNKNYIDVVSHVQIRGSIPLLWSQPSNFNFVPKVNNLL